MRVRSTILGCLAVAVLASSGAHAAPKPQVTDIANDANGTNFQGVSPALSNRPTPVGSQAYADILAVTWSAVKKGKKVTGFSVTAKLSAAPTPLAGTSLVYRVLGTTSRCGFFGVAYYTSKSSDPKIPQSAVRDNCIAETTRLTAIPLPKISGSTITWTVPFTAIPKDTKVGLGTKLTDLRMTVHEIEDFRVACFPTAVPTYGGSCGLGAGMLDDAVTTATYTLGK